MTNLRDMALNLIANSPAVASNPRNQAMIDVLQSGDQAKGEKLANNLLKSYGMTKDQALEQAQRFFGFKR